MPNQTIPLSAAQSLVLAHAASTLVVGPAGSGKTLLLVEKASQLTAKGQTVALSTFAFRGLEFLRHFAENSYPQLSTHIAQGLLKAGTLVELAQAQLATVGPVHFATNNQVREILRTLIIVQGFTGTLPEAEHIVRNAKGRAKKLPEASPHYPLLTAYQAKLEEFGLLDRYDIIRKHILGMKSATVPPLQVQHILLDNLEDANELQLIWLQMHQNQGIHLTLAANDDTTAYSRDGALGPQAITQVEDWPDITRFNLPTSFRTPPALAPACAKIARQLRTRHPKAEETASTTSATLQVENFPNPAAEHAFLATTCSQLLGQNPNHTIGLITRNDFSAALITHALRKKGLNPASFARLIWEDPTPQLILAMLYVLLNQATPAHLHLALLGFGIPSATIQQWLESGLTAENWLPSGCPLPPIAGLSPTIQSSAQKAKRSFSGAFQLWQSKTLGPREIFKSLVAEALPNIPEPDHPQALLATDMLLTLSGKLTEILPRVLTETMPNMHSSITVAPVREVRNMQFQTTILPYAGANLWPHPPYTVLGPDADHERRLFLLAISRTAGNLILTHHTPQPPPHPAELKQALKPNPNK